MSSDSFDISDNEPVGLGLLDPYEARQRMANEYTRLRAAWFPNEHDTAATLQWLYLAEGSDDLDWGYSHNARLLRVVVREGDLAAAQLNDFASEANPTDVYHNFGALGSWRVYLAHELCHEWQFVVLNDQADDWGEQQFAERGQHWPGPGHTAAFYTAIRDFVQHFELDLDHVLDSI
tara:strand:- start:14551 stop:15081 length:531 start_codon:yes stop_codon:yes gene_type:complete